MIIWIPNFLYKMTDFGGITFVAPDLNLHGTETILPWESGGKGSSSTTD